MCDCCFKPNFDKTELIQLNRKDLNIQLPIFGEVITNSDKGIQYVVLSKEDTKPGEILIDIYWEDEWHPCFLFDWVYRLVRKCKYSRTYDHQSIRIYVTDEKKIYKCYSSNWADDGSSYNVCIAKHRCFTYPLVDFELINGDPVVYISTWNHMYSKEPLDPIEYDKNNVYPIYCKNTDVEYFTDIVNAN